MPEISASQDPKSDANAGQLSFRSSRTPVLSSEHSESVATLLVYGNGNNAVTVAVFTLATTVSTSPELSLTVGYTKTKLPAASVP